MKELALKYGCNPNQKPARIFIPDGSELPVTVLNGRPGYINFLAALNCDNKVSLYANVKGEVKLFNKHLGD